MPDSLLLLCATAASIGVLHTALGPDHYLPFVAMARAGGWSVRRTVAITLLCGVGHIVGSVLLGTLGIALGVALFQLETIEERRGDLAAWLMIAFGLAYVVWGARRALRLRAHSHEHVHADGTRHAHTHDHRTEHAHPHPTRRRSLTPWVLFSIFVFGPCEPLIPLLMYPAAAGSVGHVALVTAIFAAATLVTMVSAVLLALHLQQHVSFSRLAGWEHALAGLVILACGAAMQVGL